jgi:uncharacterized membrane protein HdeD (DUF308 family)
MEVLSRNWGWVVFRGIVAVLFGVLTLYRPGITLAALVLLFGAYAFVDGIALIVWAIANHRFLPRWPALVIGGICGVAAGIVTLLWPGITAMALLVVIAAWAIMIGIVTLVSAFRLRKVITGEWRLIVAGLLAVALGMILLAAPAVGALAMIVWIGWYAIFSGGLLVALGFKIRNLGRLLGHAKLASHPA